MSLEIYKSFPDEGVREFEEVAGVVESRRPPLNIEAPLQLWDVKYYTWWRYLENPSDIIQKEERAKGLSILHNMRERDTEISQALVVRARAIVALDWLVQPADESDLAKQIAEEFEVIMQEINSEALIDSLTYAAYYGVQAHEIPWKYNPRTGNFDFTTPIAIPPWAVAFEKETQAFMIRKWSQYDAVPTTPGRFLVSTNPDPCNGLNPYGLADGLDVYWPARWKNAVLTAWLSAAGRIGGPSIIGYYPKGSTKAQQDDLYDVIKTIQTNQSAIALEGTKIESPDLGRISVRNFFEGLAGYFDSMIRKRLTGSDLATSQGTGQTGTYAMSQTHAEVGRDCVEGLARQIQRQITELAKLYTYFNYGDNVPCPQFRIDYEGREDQVKFISWLKILTVDMGVAVKKTEVFERAGLTEPGEDDETIGGTTAAEQHRYLHMIDEELPPTKPTESRGGIPDNEDEPEPEEDIHRRTDYSERHFDFASAEKLSRKRAGERDRLIGEIINYYQDAPEGYRAYMKGLLDDIRASTNWDEAKKLGISSGLVRGFAASLKDAVASMMALRVGHLADQRRKDVKFAETVTAEFFTYQKAVDYMRARMPQLSEDYYALVDARSQEWAFTVSNIEAEKTIEAVQKSLTTAMKEGQTFPQWKEKIESILSEGDLEALRPGQLETVFRTNMQTSYAAADEIALNEVDPKSEWYDRYTYVTSQQENVCEICAPRDGMVFKRDDDTNKPPLHYNCNCDIIYETNFDGGAPEYSDESERERLMPPLAGFDSSPAKTMKVGIR